MSLNARFRRHGQRRELRVLNDECIGYDCWSPIVVLEPVGHAKNPREWCLCETRLASGCPPPLDPARHFDASVARHRSREWVKA